MSASTTSGLEPFPSTHWTLVADAGHSDGAAKRKALGTLLARYMGPLRSHVILKLRIEPAKADDFLQGFFVSQVFDRDLIARAEAEKGRFRNFLVVAFDRYVYNCLRHERTEKARTTYGAGALDDATPHPAPAPDEEFDRAWAQTVLAEAVQRMKQTCQALARPDIWGVFEARILEPAQSGTPVTPYSKLVERFHFVSPSQATNVLVTAKRMFARSLRSVVAEYETEAEINNEIQDLRALLST